MRWLVPIVLPALAVACGQEQSPSFQERSESRRINLTVAGDPSGDAMPKRRSLGDLDAVSIFEDAESGENLGAWTGDESTEGDDAGDDGSMGGGDADADPYDCDSVACSGAGGGSTGGGSTGGGSTGGGSGDETLGEWPTGGTGGGSTGGDSTAGGGSGGGDTTAGGSTGGGTTGGSTGGGSTGGDSTAGGGSTGGDTTTGGSTGGDGYERPTDAEIKACAKLQGVSPDRIKIVGNQNDVRLTRNTVAAIKITGNQNRLVLDIAGGSGARLAGLCLFLAGNQSRADVSLGLTLERLVYVGRGNQSSGVVSLGSSGAVEEMAIDLAGNRASFRIHGAGAAEACSGAQVRAKGNGSTFHCQ